jgi:hypothetical protein
MLVAPELPTTKSRRSPNLVHETILHPNFPNSINAELGANINVRSRRPTIPRDPDDYETESIPTGIVSSGVFFENFYFAKLIAVLRQDR